MKVSNDRGATVLIQPDSANRSTKLNAQRREQIVAICQSLVELQTLSGQEQPVIERTAQWMRDLGYSNVNVDACGNVTGALYGSAGPTVLYDSHVDTVAAQDGDAWSYPPFAGTIAHDRIYGRGTSDMKGALAASLAALAYAKEDGVLRGTALVSASVGEEIIEGLAIHDLISTYKPDLVVICESTGLKLNIAGRGRAEITLTVQGKSAHASNPQYGVNALRQMSKLVLALDTIQPPHDPQLGDGILEPTEVISSPFPSVSVVPWRCSARYDRRLLVGEDQAAALDPIHRIIAQLSATDPTFSATATIDVGEFACYTGLILHAEKFQPAWRLNPNDAWVQAAQTVLQQANQTAETGHYSFCTNGSYTAGVVHIPTLGYGPGYEQTAHTTDEYLELEQLFGAAEGYYALGTLSR